jgi:hypothetical protein
MPAPAQTTRSFALLRGLFVRAMAAALLIMIALQATVPGQVSLHQERGHQERGSAFSALTADVSLAPRPDSRLAERLLPLPDPLPAPPPTLENAERASAEVLPAPHAPAPPLLTLSPRDRPEIPVSPREPPFS